jgi:hypothetical protein
MLWLHFRWSIIRTWTSPSYTNVASDNSLAYIFSQKGSDGRISVVCYGNPALFTDERRWSVTDKECLAVLEGIRIYKQYLIHRQFKIYTDYKSLIWLHNVKATSSRLGRWSMEMQAYNYEIVHRKDLQIRIQMPCVVLSILNSQECLFLKILNSLKKQQTVAMANVNNTHLSTSTV